MLTAEHPPRPHHRARRLGAQCARTEPHKTGPPAATGDPETATETGVHAAAVARRHGNIHVSGVVVELTAVHHRLVRGVGIDRMLTAVGSPLALRYLRPDWVAPLGASSLIFNFMFAYWLVGTRTLCSVRAAADSYSGHNIRPARDVVDHSRRYPHDHLQLHQPWSQAGSLIRGVSALTCAELTPGCTHSGPAARGSPTLSSCSSSSSARTSLPACSARCLHRAPPSHPCHHR